MRAVRSRRFAVTVLRAPAVGQAEERLKPAPLLPARRSPRIRHQSVRHLLATLAFFVRELRLCGLAMLGLHDDRHRSDDRRDGTVSGHCVTRTARLARHHDTRRCGHAVYIARGKTSATGRAVISSPKYSSPK